MEKHNTKHIVFNSGLIGFEPEKEWVAVDDLIEFCKLKRINFDDTKEKMLQGDWNNAFTLIIKELSKEEKISYFHKQMD